MTKKVKLRSLLIGGAFTLLFVVLVTRLYWVQVVQGEELLAMAKAKWAMDKEIQPVRGTIMDRNGKALAEDVPSYTVALIPDIIFNKGLEFELVKRLAEILSPEGDTKAAAALEEKIRSRIHQKRDDGTYYAQREIGNEGWKIDGASAEKIKALIEELQQRSGKKNESVGIVLLPESKRFYPSEKLASHLIGYTNKEDKPIMGLELTMDKVLKGSPGRLEYEKDRKGVELPDSQSRYQPAINGSHVKLTLDKNIQFYLESALEKTYNKFKPKSITAIAVDPQTMEILGMANMPDFNPNKYWETKDQKNFINHAVASQYEPGSTFKLVTLAATVEEGLFNPSETFMSGSIQVPGRRLHDHNISGWGKISYLEGLKRSSNVAFVKLGLEKLGQDKLRQYIDKFGFGAKTNVDIPGEVPGVVNMHYPAEFATATYGQGLTATAIQQVAAYAAAANGGKLMWPHLIKEITDPETGQVIEKFEPKVIRNVISEKTSSQVSGLLEGVVSDQEIGTGRKAYIDGYRIAGKTGTANKVLPGEKGYAEGKWVISFIGYAPIENPKLLVAIIADEPDLGGDYHRGGDVAAPAFREIVSQSLRYLGIAPSIIQTQSVASPEKIKMPNLYGMTIEQAKAALNPYGISIEPVGKGTTILAQSPLPDTEIDSVQRTYVVMQEPEQTAVPSLTGKSLRDALEVCSLLKIQCTTVGEGYVADQALAEGDGRTLTLTLKPYTQLLETDVSPKPEEKPAQKPVKPPATPPKSNGGR